MTRFRNASIAVAILVTILVGQIAGTARGAVPLPQSIASDDYTWDITNSIDGPVGVEPAFGVADVNGPFDDPAVGFGEFRLNGQPFLATANAVEIQENPSGRFLQARARMGGLRVVHTIQAFNNSNTLRHSYVITNSTGRRRHADVTWGTRHTSGATTEINNTTNNDAVLDPDEPWAVISDSAVTTDPFVVVAFGNRREVATQANTPPGDFSRAFSFDIRRGRSVGLLFYVHVAPTLAAANSFAPKFDDMQTLGDASLTFFLTRMERRSYNYGPPTI